jgi:hypothetical protein
VGDERALHGVEGGAGQTAELVIDRAGKRVLS